ncbi:YdeI/OmpD-associated family protein [uncultured Pseudoxanthomonas sp.]|uniref:YdeI/OmpD-associated family protein n=1 Tax=uncultured Pseudoxanthomonas sp. TaxID=281701 RepID=UPI0026094C33|nr:YdeI/OmpD-associated family protein [uncultured Pseudoxanthomonas sp.]
MAAPDLPTEHFADAAAWERWLEGYAASSAGVWLKIAKKGTGIPSVTYAEALDVALCHGWIDGQKKGFDAQFFLQRFTPRRARSIWSKINVAKIEALTAAGRMRPAGQREVDAARADGRWDAAYDGAKSMEVPPELAKALALARHRKAKAFFDTLDRTNRYAVCWRVQTAVKAETKQARVEKLVAMLARGEKIHG